ncbi:MAG: hypothetical protein AUK48_13150 [Oscillatoriales cyanobacterium CG2_30_44_21]|nr:MAG: hypothetical protein AUK48_13150 [Oscillatoriales cyanobacterium CG2_30_44_21]
MAGLVIFKANLKIWLSKSVVALCAYLNPREIFVNHDSAVIHKNFSGITRLAKAIKNLTGFGS